MIPFFNCRIQNPFLEREKCQGKQTKKKQPNQSISDNNERVRCQGRGITVTVEEEDEAEEGVEDKILSV